MSVSFSMEAPPGFSYILARSARCEVEALNTHSLCSFRFSVRTAVLIRGDCIALKTRHPLRGADFSMEAPPGFEPGNNGFANHCLNHLAMAPYGLFIKNS